MCGDPYGFMCDNCFGRMMEARKKPPPVCYEEIALCAQCEKDADAYWALEEGEVQS